MFQQITRFFSSFFSPSPAPEPPKVAAETVQQQVQRVQHAQQPHFTFMTAGLWALKNFFTVPFYYDPYQRKETESDWSVGGPVKSPKRSMTSWIVNRMVQGALHGSILAVNTARTLVQDKDTSDDMIEDEREFLSDCNPFDKPFERIVNKPTYEDIPLRVCTRDFSCFSLPTAVNYPGGTDRIIRRLSIQSNLRRLSKRGQPSTAPTFQCFPIPRSTELFQNLAIEEENNKWGVIDPLDLSVRFVTPIAPPKPPRMHRAAV